VKFAKLHGAGNDYIYIDARGMEADWPTLAQAMSHRHFGVGGDGIILALPSQMADLRMRMFNADGSEAEMCGNGIRCLVRFALERGILPPDIAPAGGEGKGESVQVETLAGVLTVEPIFQGGIMTRARVGMGVPRLRPQEIPVDPAHRLVQIGARQGSGVRGQGTGNERVLDWPIVVEGHQFRVTGVSMGNPHAVAFVEEPVDTLPLHLVGPMVEHHPLFPRRVNFEVVNIVDRGHLRARVWERGSGETMACGTGACAIAVAARLHGYTDGIVDITLPGGTLAVAWDGKDEVVLEGPVTRVYEGDWEPG
jgi:diaminopimelate epimerase